MERNYKEKFTTLQLLLNCAKSDDLFSQIEMDFIKRISQKQLAR